MKIWHRVTLICVGVLTLAIVAGVLALHALADPEHLKIEAQAKARAAWSRELAIGTLDVQVFPRPTLVATDVALANPPWAGARELIRVKRVAARLALWPLLMGRLHVEVVAIEGARASLEVARDGAKSWALPSAEAKGTTASEWTHIRVLEISDSDLFYGPKGATGKPWHIATARLDAQDGLKDVRLDAQLLRNGHPVHAKAQLSDLSHAGQAAAIATGTLDLDWGKTRFSAKGTIPLDGVMERTAFDASLESTSLDDMLAFFELRPRHTAPLRIQGKVAGSADEVDLRDLAVTLGKQHMSGDLRLIRSGAAPVFIARLQSADLDWGQALVDAGDPRPLPPPPGELFPVRPLPWPLLVSMQGRKGTADFELGRLLLPDGIEVRNAKGRMSFDGDRLDLRPVSVALLGGSATGTMRFEGRKKAVHVRFAASELLLERWFHERHRTVPFTGGPMKIKADVSMTGDSMKELAASMNGPVSMRMGPGVYASQAAGDWEQRMVKFSKDGSAGEIDFECAGAALDFSKGRANGHEIIGARSPKSRLLTSGYLDLREQAVDLTGRVRPKPGEGVGLATIADDIRIDGPIRKMHVALDAASTPKVIAKAAGAIATVGLSVLATAASNASSSDPDPCEAVFTAKHPPRP